MLQVINGLGTGGAERSIAESLPLFADAGIELIIACRTRRSEGVQEQVQDSTCDVRFLSGKGSTKQLLELRELIRSATPDLVHTTIFESDILGRLAAAGSGVPVLTSLVNTSYEPIRFADPNVGRAKLWGARTLDGWTARHLTEHFHAISEAVKESAIRWLRIPADRITVIARGRDTGRLGRAGGERRRRAREALGLSPDDRVLVNVGRQEYQKGQRFLLRAFSSLLGERPALRLLMAGRTGNASMELEGEVRALGVGDRVDFLGHRDDLPEILAAADLFVFPSLYEGLGGALIEAMALGLPIVASDVPAIREVVERDRNAILVAPGDVEALAQGISQLLDDEIRAREFGHRSREIFEERFTLEKSVGRMIELYRKLARTA